MGPCLGPWMAAAAVESWCIPLAHSSLDLSQLQWAHLLRAPANRVERARAPTDVSWPSVLSRSVVPLLLGRCYVTITTVITRNEYSHSMQTNRGCTGGAWGVERGSWGRRRDVSNVWQVNYLVFVFAAIRRPAARWWNLLGIVIRSRPASTWSTCSSDVAREREKRHAQEDRSPWLKSDPVFVFLFFLTWGSCANSQAIQIQINMHNTPLV